MDIYEILNKYKKYTSFTYGKCNDEDITKIEKKLNVKLPEDYIKYIKTFGGGGISGTEIYGISSIGKFKVVDETENYRKCGMPKELGGKLKQLEEI